MIDRLADFFFLSIVPLAFLFAVYLEVRELKNEREWRSTFCNGIGGCLSDGEWGDKKTYEGGF